MAPEICPKNKVSLTPYSRASDVYAFGFILWDLFAGKDPYPGMEKPEEIFEISLKGKRPTIPETCPVKNLIPKCWDQDPAKRLSAKELIVENENYFKVSLR